MIAPLKLITDPGKLVAVLKLFFPSPAPTDTPHFTFWTPRRIQLIDLLGILLSPALGLHLEQPFCHSLSDTSTAEMPRGPEILPTTLINATTKYLHKDRFCQAILPCQLHGGRVSRINKSEMCTYLSCKARISHMQYTE